MRINSRFAYTALTLYLFLPQAGCLSLLKPCGSPSSENRGHYVADAEKCTSESAPYCRHVGDADSEDYRCFGEDTDVPAVPAGFGILNSPNEVSGNDNGRGVGNDNNPVSPRPIMRPAVNGVGTKVTVDTPVEIPELLTRAHPTYHLVPRVLWRNGPACPRFPNRRLRARCR